MVLVFTNMISSALLSWYLIKNYGLIGGAYGIVFTLVITALIKVLLLNRFLQINYLNVLKQALYNYPLILKVVWRKLHAQ